MMYQSHQAPYLQTVTGFLHHSPLPALPPPSHLQASNIHHHFQTNTTGGDANESDATAASASASAVLLFEARQTNRELRLQLTDALLKLDRLLAKVDEIGSERSTDVVLRSSLSANASGFESGPLKSSYFQLSRENDELKSKLSEMTIKLQSHQDNISRLLENNQKLLEQNVDLMGRSFDSPANQSMQATSDEATSMWNSLSAAASEELGSLRVELASMRTRETECQRQIEKLIKMDQESKLQLKQSDLQLKDWSQTMERLSAELNEEKRRRKEAEMTSRALATDAEDTKTKNAALQKTLSDLKISSKSKITELESDVKSLQDNHKKELSMVKERWRIDKSRTQEDHSEMLRQTEDSLNSSWKRKYENLEKTLKDRHTLQVDELSAERSFLVDRVASLEQKVAELKSLRTAEESSRTELVSEMEEYRTWKGKYDNLRAQAISMKERYVQQMDGLKEESSLLEEKCNRMTDKYYKAEESLSIATQKYEEFMVRSIEGRKEFEAKVHQLEAELVSIKSELYESQRQGVQSQLELEEATNKYLRLAEKLEVLEKEQEQENSHVVEKSVAPLARKENIKTQGDVAPLGSSHEVANELLLTPLEGVNNKTYKHESIIIEKQLHDQDQKEEQDQREPEEEEQDDDDDDDDDDDGDSFVTTLSDEDAVWCVNKKTEDVTCFDQSTRRDSRISRSDDLENNQCSGSHLDLHIACSSVLENDSGASIVSGNIEKEHQTDALETSVLETDALETSVLETDALQTSVLETSALETSVLETDALETNALDIQRSCNYAKDIDKSNDPAVHFDMNLENDLERTEVMNNNNESDLSLPSKASETSFDLSNNLHSSIESDPQSHDHLEEIREYDLDVVLDNISEQRASDDLQRKTHQPPRATETMPTALTPNQTSKSEEPSSQEDPVGAVATFSTNQTGGSEHEGGTAGNLESTGDGYEIPSRSEAESERLQESTFFPSSKDVNSDRETFAEDFEHKENENDRMAENLENTEINDRSESQSELKHSKLEVLPETGPRTHVEPANGTSSSTLSKVGNYEQNTSSEGYEQRKNSREHGKLESTDRNEHIKCQPGYECEGESTQSDNHDKDENCDEMTSDLGVFEEKYDEQEADDSMYTVTFEQEADDSLYTVTSGGKIVPECVTESDEVAMASGRWLADTEGGQGADDAWIQTQLTTTRINLLRPSKNDPSERHDVEGTSLSGADGESKEQTGTSDGIFEDPVYSVTSGGQIVSGWADVEDPLPDEVRNTIPEVDQQQPTGRRTSNLDVTEVLGDSSWSSGVTDAPGKGFSQSGEVSGTTEDTDVGSETSRGKAEEPVARIGACVILREEDIEKMMERRKADSLESQEKAKKKKKKKK